MDGLEIREASEDEAGVLTDISFTAKAYWNYPDEYFNIWREELTITPQYILSNDVFIAAKGDQVIGYYSLVHLEQDLAVAGPSLTRGYWLEHMFVQPRYIGQGVGRAMMRHLRSFCCERRRGKIFVLSDPHARGFYEKMGWEYLREFPSTISGRATPCLSLVD